MRIHKKAAGALAAAALATVGAVSVTGPAQAAAAGCVLSITPVRGNISYLHVSNRCVPERSTDKITQTIYWGADWPDNDDYLLDRRYPSLWDTFTVHRVSLNEDSISRDEVYTENRFVRTNGTYYIVKSNEVRKEFVPT
ncbi:hypothetical protein SAMN04489712_102684 [Thermomonospora echinospora]|uniref:Secreted protein n=1 Tax=Thermomonospora echinospora TaxID=1992 RepID=A0A1H5WDD5_9ACTN|nr:hypothetical protein [Thermomonospora echinospora]SEF97599.1 hypothetical protein SAMN04489712_102684 [Thermomonospora echinospora]